MVEIVVEGACQLPGDVLCALHVRDMTAEDMSSLRILPFIKCFRSKSSRPLKLMHAISPQTQGSTHPLCCQRHFCLPSSKDVLDPTAAAENLWQNLSAIEAAMKSLQAPSRVAVTSSALCQFCQYPLPLPLPLQLPLLLLLLLLPVFLLVLLLVFNSCFIYFYWYYDSYI